jgi:hypothetical protein
MTSQDVQTRIEISIEKRQLPIAIRKRPDEILNIEIALATVSTVSGGIIYIPVEESAFEQFDASYETRHFSNRLTPRVIDSCPANAPM